MTYLELLEQAYHSLQEQMLLEGCTDRLMDHRSLVEAQAEKIRPDITEQWYNDFCLANGQEKLYIPTQVEVAMLKIVLGI